MAADIKTTSCMTFVVDASGASADEIRMAIGVLLCLLDLKQPSQSDIKVRENLKADEIKARALLDASP